MQPPVQHHGGGPHVPHAAGANYVLPQEAITRDSVEATEGNVEARVHNNSHQANHSPPAEGVEKSTIVDIFIKIKPHSGGGVLSDKHLNLSMTTNHLNNNKYLNQ